jgi:malonate transporter and related proteins
MPHTVIGTLLPIVVTLVLGFFAAWHKDFSTDQASVMNRMVMLYALPMSLFAGNQVHAGTRSLGRITAGQEER